jgi:predicted amidophosphoribosyltransferase
MSRKREEMLKRSKGCPNYKPCPLCYSCENKATHLYVECESCEVPWDHHNHTAKSYMIKRPNFAIRVSEEAKEQLRELAEV